MEEIKKHYFEGNHIKVHEVTEMMMQRPAEAENLLRSVINVAGFLMKKEALEEKYKHKMRELYEEYDIDFNE